MVSSVEFGAKVIWVNVEEANALSPIVFTEDGIVILVKSLQLLNILLLMVVTESGIVIAPLQFLAHSHVLHTQL
jgi:hypothetical protein